MFPFLNSPVSLSSAPMVRLLFRISKSTVTSVLDSSVGRAEDYNSKIAQFGWFWHAPLRACWRWAVSLPQVSLFCEGFPCLSFCLIRSCYLVALAIDLNLVRSRRSSCIEWVFSSGDTTKSQYISGNQLWLIPYFRHVRAVSNKFECASLLSPICLPFECFQGLPSTGFHLE